MHAYICTACGTQYPPSESSPGRCTICEDERQFVPLGGQGWTTLEAMRLRHFNAWRQHEPGLIGIGSQPTTGNVGTMVPEPTGTVQFASGRGSQGAGHTVYGYLRVRASAKIVQATFVQTLADHRNAVEAVAIDLATGKETSPQFD